MTVSTPANSSDGSGNASAANPTLNLASSTRSAKTEVTAQGIAFPVNSRLLLGFLLGVMLVVLSLHLWVASYFLQGLEFRGSRRFYFDNEGNLPAYFSTFIIFIAACLLSVISFFKRTEADAFARHWTVLALVFFGLAVDEALSFHEMLIDPMRKAFGLTGLMRFAWVLVGGVFVTGFALAYLPFLAKLTFAARRGFVVAGAVYVMGVLGFEMLSGPFFEALESGGGSGPYIVLMTIEETLEMSGMLLFIKALLAYLRDYKPVFSLSLG